MRRSLGAAAMAAALFAGSGAIAHHSAAMFDHSRIVEIEGTVKSFSYQAPHSWISILGSPDAKTPIQQWDLELGAPVALDRWGITKDTLKPGDKVSAGLYPLRDGRTAGSLLFITDAQGKPHGVRREDAFAALPK